MQIEEFNKNVQKLYQQVQQQFTGDIEITLRDPMQRWLSFDQSGHRITKKGSLQIVIIHSSDINFTLAHELRHILLELDQGLMLDFPVTTTQPQVDQQLKATSLSLIGCVEHGLIMQQHRKAGEIKKSVESQFVRGWRNKLTPEEDDDTQFILRLLLLIDALVFSNGADLDHWKDKYPKAYAQANMLYKQVIAPAKLGTPSGMRHAIVKLFSYFNNVLIRYKYQELPYQDFVALQPILSERQLRLKIEQVFRIKRLDFLSKRTNQQAIVLLGDADLQLVADVQLSAEAKKTPQGYLSIYQRNVKEFLEEQNISYQIR